MMLFILRYKKYLYILLAVSGCIVALNFLKGGRTFEHEILSRREIPGGTLYFDRVETVHKFCGGHRGIHNLSIKNNEDLLDHILVDSRHQLLYCYIPKVACTNWKRIFMILSGQSNVSDIMSIPAHEAHRNIHLTLRNYTAVDAQHLLDTYTKFLFVRHPFERLLSAYRNKLEQHYLSSKYFQERIGKQIINKYRTSAINSSQNNGNDVTFEEFTAFLVNSTSSHYNEHWKPMHNLCEPCFIKYDFVGKYDTLWADAKFILNSIGVSHLTLPFAPKRSSTSKELKKYFSTLSLSRIRDLYNIYELDFKLFSYNLSDLLGYEIA